jgi:Bardet-Biedl syndrome 9 protein
MSLFKTREWWTTTVGENEMFDLGCLCVADLNYAESDKLIVGSFHGRLAIYEPSPSKGEDNGRSCKANDMICEVQLSDPILQVEAGRFVSGSDATHVAVLHPRKLTVFGLSSIPGLTEHGIQYQLRSLYEHKFQRTAFNFCYGPFGGVKGRDFICVQSVDGTISVFEQESFTFTRFLPGALLPGPIRYVGRTDSIITVASSRQIDSFKFQILATARDEGTKEVQNITKGKRVQADWSLLINETALDLVVANFPNSPLTIFVLGERNLYAVSESGQLMFMKKFDFDPACFIPYAAGSNETVRYMIATHGTNTLLVFENSRLMWAARLLMTPVQLKVANFKDHVGMVVALDDEGHLSCLYLGTDPSVISHPSAYARELNYSAVESEMKQLQNIIKDQDKKASLPTPSQFTDEDLKLTIDVPPQVDRSSRAMEVEIEDEMPVPSITLTISLRAKVALSNVKLTCTAVSPLVTDEGFTTLTSVAPGSPAEVKVRFYMKHRLLPTDLRVSAHAVYYTNTGAPRVVQTSTHLPLSIVMRPSLPVKEAAYKLTIDTNKQPVALDDLFSDLWCRFCEDTSNVVGFKYYGLEPVVTILASKSSQRYRVQCDHFGYMWHMTSELTRRLASRFKMGASSDFRISYSGDLPLQEYCNIIDQHFMYRFKNDALMKTLEGYAAQFRSTQKRLLILFKDKTPAPLKGLDTLLDDTFRQIMHHTDLIEANNKMHAMQSAELSCTTHIIVLLLKLKLNLPADEVAALESVLSPVVNNTTTTTAQGWEEMTDAAITHILRTSLSKNVKDVTLNPAPLTPLKDTTTLKKHLALMCDRLVKGGRLTLGSSSSTSGRPLLDAGSTRSHDKDSVAVAAVNDVNDDISPQISSGRIGHKKQKSSSRVDAPSHLNSVAAGEPLRSSGLDNWDASAPAQNSDSFRGTKVSQHKRKKTVKSLDSVPDLDNDIFGPSEDADTVATASTDSLDSTKTDVVLEP